MNAFFWQMILSVCSYNMAGDEPRDYPCVDYMTECFTNRYEDMTYEKYIRCQGQWMTIKKSYRPVHKCSKEVDNGQGD